MTEKKNNQANRVADACAALAVGCSLASKKKWADATRHMEEAERIAPELGATIKTLRSVVRACGGQKAQKRK